MVGGDAGYGAGAGLGYLDSDVGVGYAWTNFGFRKYQ